MPNEIPSVRPFRRTRCGSGLRDLTRPESRPSGVRLHGNREERAFGAAQDRPELTKALQYMREVDTLVVWKLDRLALSLKQLVDTVKALEKRNIGLMSLTDAIDTTTPTGRLVLHIFAALAEFERSIIRERTKAGLASAKARGRLGGRPRALQEADVKVAKALLRDGELTVAEVAKRLGLAPSTLHGHVPQPRSTSGAGMAG